MTSVIATSATGSATPASSPRACSHLDRYGAIVAPPDAGNGAVEVGQQKGLGVLQEPLPVPLVVLGGQGVRGQGDAFQASVDLRVEVERGLVQVGADEDHRPVELSELGVEVLFIEVIRERIGRQLSDIVLISIGMNIKRVLHLLGTEHICDLANIVPASLVALNSLIVAVTGAEHCVVHLLLNRRCEG